MSENSSKKENLFNELVENATNRTKINPKYYERYNVKRGLRNDDGTGVLVGLTEVGEVFSYIMDDAERVPTEGRLFYRGIEINDLVNGFYQEKRYGYEECVYLLLFGELPNSDQLYQFEELLTEYRQLPASFTEDMIMKATGNHYLNSGILDTNAQMMELYENAIEENKRLGFEVGSYLTEEQTKSLEKDILWYVSKFVNNSLVLVPVLY
ncbi:hypothetical protein EOM86_03430, partial [Candidatus Nomurabacteria bacterium]|nr:hypothetical protein [Candidatus Nomurabacteria bacterium]